MTNYISSSRLIRKLLNEKPEKWVIAFSGGKDSSLVLSLFWSAIERGYAEGTEVVVLYCDTGAENPIAAKLALNTLENLSSEARLKKLPLRSVIVKPEITRTLMVRIIGRGYPPPNNFFRWCTKDLRVLPVQKYIFENLDDGIVVTGVRKDESSQRSRSIGNNENPYWTVQREGTGSKRIFMPIVDLSVDQVWEGLEIVPGPDSMDMVALWNLYKDASSECPVIRTPDDPPCGQGRFGCWLCTVVRRDKSAEKLVASGYTSLQPLLDFRKWLLEIRNLPSHRNSIRRNGRHAMGPFRLSARMEILKKLRMAEEQSGFTLLSEEELAAIHNEWAADQSNPLYLEDPVAAYI